MMKGEISIHGNLFLERAGIMSKQWCPFSEGDAQAQCGDWCPLFGEPEQEDHTIILSLCKKTLRLKGGYFKDERNPAKAGAE
jgi:hypothetical protein